MNLDKISNQTNMFNQPGNSGQIGVLVLLAMTAMLTVGIGAVTRSTQDLRVTRQEVESSRSFAAAEVGIEEALHEITVFEEQAVDGAVIEQTIVGSVQVREPLLDDQQTEQRATYQVEYQVEPIHMIDSFVQEGDVVSVNVAGVAPGTPLRIDWGGDSCDNPETQAKIVVSLISNTNPTIRRGYSKCAPHQGLHGLGGADSVLNIDELSNIEIVNIKVLGSGTNLSASGTGLPVQAYRVTSRATPEHSQEVKAVSLDRMIPNPPSIFDYALVSGTSIYILEDD